MIINQIPVGPFQVMTYLAACSRTREAVIIDPGGEEDKLLALIREKDFKVRYILNTHGHADHVVGNRSLHNVVKAPVCMHAADDRFFADVEVRETSTRELGLPPPDPVDIRLKDGDVLEVGKLKIEVLHTPGHSPGSITFVLPGDNIAFNGDTVFSMGVGRTDLWGGDSKVLRDTLKNKIFSMPGDRILYSGHGPSVTTKTASRNLRFLDF